MPFALFVVAALAINAGLSTIFNATTPMWAALVAWGWLNDRPAPMRALGLALGFAGVLALAADKASLAKEYKTAEGYVAEVQKCGSDTSVLTRYKEMVELLKSKK